MKVHWTQHALTQLDSIYEFIAQDSPVYALQLIYHITQRSAQLGQFPNSARTVHELSEPNIREVFESCYRIIYFVYKNEVRVLTILHSARSFPDNLDVDDDSTS